MARLAAGLSFVPKAMQWSVEVAAVAAAIAMESFLVLQAAWPRGGRRPAHGTGFEPSVPKSASKFGPP